MGAVISGNLKKVATQLRQLFPLHSWKNPSGNEVCLRFLVDTPWKCNNSTHQGFSRMEIDAIRWWLEKTRFTQLHGTDLDGRSFRSRQTTFVEVALAIEAETRVLLGGPNTDLARKVVMLRAGIRFLMTHCKQISVFHKNG